MTKLPLAPQNGIVIKNESISDSSKDGGGDSLVRTRQSESCLIFSSTNKHELKKDDPTAFIITQDSTDGLCIEACIDDNSNISQSIKRSELWASAMAAEMVDDLVSPRETDEAISIRPNIVTTFPPLWGLTSICGRRAEMEDAAVALPRLLQIPPQMLSDNQLSISMHKDSTAHVFGVFDGHGGNQVANYCRENMHASLAEEIAVAKGCFNFENGEHSLKDKWLKIFRKCFHRLDNEVGGFTTDGDVAPDLHVPIAPESVGSTAAVAIVCSTHIVVANCGDSRAVLNRGKLPMPLSIDHKPNREDECARIEAAGGKVINWDGYRVSGVLAVSR